MAGRPRESAFRMQLLIVAWMLKQVQHDVLLTGSEQLRSYSTGTPRERGDKRVWAVAGLAGTETGHYGLALGLAW
jgi:hypothetical protein